MFFPDGNKELGIEQLKTVANNAFYTRTEAQYFLMRILTEEQDDPVKLFASPSICIRLFRTMLTSTATTRASSTHAGATVKPKPKP